MKRKMIGDVLLKLCLLIGVLSAPVYGVEWKATVAKQMDALVSSCVVVPCFFSHPKENLPTARLRGKWHRTKEKDQLIYFEDNTRVLESFRGRTRLLGELGKGNCSLEITDIKSHDNGPFCFRIELARTETDTETEDKYSFEDDCVTMHMLPKPKDPSLTHKDPVEGRPFTVTCSVTHTCPTSRPQLTWSRGSADDITESHREIHQGLWEVSSVLTFVPAEKDDHKEVTCTAKFNGEMTSRSKMTLYVKRVENYNHIIIPVAVAVGLSAIFGGLCFLMVKKYKRRIEDLQRQDGTFFNRLSRMSRR
ncbi:myelin-associated glycoprotein-like [Eucyclogobius newberryi]|uniref:myelin-associated glycoprotein-like n=1 Tax=Eucyclogobius newberryi TaxID=166745 RepID=UPI003B5AC031